MKDNVVALPTPLTADAAWARYQALAAQIVGDRALTLDRDFMQRLVAAEAAWKACFLALKEEVQGA